MRNILLSCDFALNTKYVREHLEAIRGSLQRRKSEYPLDTLLKLDEEWRALKTKMQGLEAQHNKSSLEVAGMKKAGKDTSSAVAGLASLKKQISEMGATLDGDEKRINELLWNMPNVLHESVPYGASEDENVDVRRWGEIPEKEAPSHVDVLMKLGLIDIEQASVVSGARFYYLKGDLALLEQSLIRFCIDEMVKRGYTLIAPPLMLRREYYRGVTALGDFEELLYSIAEPKEASGKKECEHMDEGLFMISTSEHPIAAMHAGQVLNARELPRKYAGVSPCFRREAGSHGKDTKGIYRVHHFYKIEQFIFCKPEDSWKYFDEMLVNAENIFQKLKLPYRILNFCTGGIGTVAAKKNDIEVWMPGWKNWGEVASCSNCTDWQSARLDIKYEEKGKRDYVHTLNSTALATTRAMVAIVENYYSSDGSITVPDALVPYMGKSRIA